MSSGVDDDDDDDDDDVNPKSFITTKSYQGTRLNHFQVAAVLMACHQWREREREVVAMVMVVVVE